MGATAHSSNRWAQSEVSLSDLVNLLTNPDNVQTREKKDGHCFVAGAIVGSRRTGEAVEYIDVLVFDIDGDQRFDDVKYRMDESGYAYMMYTTHSHTTTNTFIPLTKIARFAQKNRIEIGNKKPHMVPCLLEKFLEDQKHRSRYKNLVINERTVHQDNGLCAHITHDKLDKFRVILPLARPLVFADIGNTSKETIAAWKSRYREIAGKLGLIHDEACEDPARLYYLPAVPPGKEELWRSYTNINLPEGEGNTFIDVYDFEGDDDDEDEDGNTTSTGARRGGGGKIDAGGVRVFKPHVGDHFNVSDWCSRYLRGVGGTAFFHLLCELKPDLLREGESASKLEEGFRNIECPFEDEHTDSGGTGTFIKLDPDNEDYISIRCLHDACHGRLNEDFVLRMLQDGWITRDHLSMVQRVVAHAHGREDDIDIEREVQAQLTTFRVPDGSGLQMPNVQLETKEQTESKLFAAIDKITTLDQRVKDYLNECSTIMGFKTFWVTIAEQEGIERDTANETVMAALSRLSFRDLQTYYAGIKEWMTMTLFEFQDIIGGLREQAEPVSVAFTKIYEDNLRNDKLDQALKRVAGYYNHPVERTINDYRQFANGQRSDAEVKVRKRAEEFNEQYAKLIEGGKTLFVDVDHFGKTGELRVYSKEGVRDLHSNETYEVVYSDKKTTYENAFDWWLKEIPDHVIYHGRKFAPDQFGKDVPFLNTYTGLNAVKAVQGDTSPLTSHILNIWCNGDPKLYAWVMTWFAQIVQDPGHRYPSSIMLIGDQGTGKSMVMDKCFGKIFDPYVFTATKRSDISGDFNAHMNDKLLFIGEEALFRGDLKTMDQLKAYISARQFGMTRKGVDTEQNDFFARFFFSSNHADALHLDQSDRRFLVLKASNDRRQDIEYFQALADYLADGGVEHVKHLLQTWKPEEYGLTWNDLFRPPVTEAKLFQMEQSLAVPETFWMELVVNGYAMNVAADDEAAQFVWPLHKPALIKLRDLQGMYANYITRTENRAHNRRKFSSAFTNIFGYDINTLTETRASTTYAPADTYVRFPPRLEIVNKVRNQMTEKQYELAIKEPADEGDIEPISGRSADRAVG